jgi:hypothetical protein
VSQTATEVRRSSSITNDLPILPYSKHQYDLSMPEQSKFGLYNKNDRYISEINARKRLTVYILRANMQVFVNELK